MRVIPVLDLARGEARWGRHGLRETYVPVRSPLIATPGDARALVVAYRGTLGCDECYVADLDALAGGAVQRAALRDLAKLGGRLIVDAGVATPERARDLLADGVHRVVVALETLPSFAALAAVTHAVGPLHVIFSLDLRNGRPVCSPPFGMTGTPVELSGAALAAGASGLLLLDLARVGSAQGVDVVLLRALRRAYQSVELLAGGGVATRRQLEQLADIGVDAALVGTALHDGSLSGPDLAAVRHRDHASDSR
jgi:phosphoribosylformimino-5-aminoimidazole carboxamide ribotide isomerase